MHEMENFVRADHYNKWCSIIGFEYASVKNIEQAHIFFVDYASKEQMDAFCRD